MRQLALKALLFLALLPTVGSAQDLRYPTVISMTNWAAGGGFADHNLSATTDAVYAVLYAKEAATFPTVCARYGLRTGTPPTYKIGVETVANTGFASGTYKTGTGECSATFTPPASTAWDGTWQCFTLTGTTCAVTRGEAVALTIRYSAGTINGSNFSSFTAYQNETYSSTFDFNMPNNNYSVTVVAGTPTKNAYAPVIEYKNASRNFGYPISGTHQSYPSSDTDPDEWAARFQLPCPSGQTFKLSGVHVIAGTPGASKSVKVSLYDGTTDIATTTLDTDQMVSIGGSRVGWLGLFTNATLPTLSCVTTYRVGLAPQETSSGLEILTTSVEANQNLDAYPLGKETYVSTRVNGGAWTDITNRRLKMALIVDKLDAVAAANYGGFW